MEVLKSARENIRCWITEDANRSMEVLKGSHTSRSIYLLECKSFLYGSIEGCGRSMGEEWEIYVNRSYMEVLKQLLREWNRVTAMVVVRACVKC